MSGMAALAVKNTGTEASINVDLMTTDAVQASESEEATTNVLRRVARGDVEYRIKNLEKKGLQKYSKRFYFKENDPEGNCPNYIHYKENDPECDSSNSVIDIPNFFTKITTPDGSINTLQEWEGLVSSVEDGFFVARLHDVSGRRQGEDWAEIPLNDVNLSERGRVVPGALFHIIVGYTTRDASRRKEILIYFRRHLPKTKNTFQNVSRLIQELSLS
ncbi:hypothetical protein [Acetobacter thailandicus]|uniref:hypothetical protein n=1 Tax=Acetobacter thailandicus TaxID=1502842 RepID=UPI001BAB9360|nr:hypothetical protein [Acetobacter thailandicus]MBS1004139.1 hypothetical protein [Acetobacter thailandicus]